MLSRWSPNVHVAVHVRFNFQFILVKVWNIGTGTFSADLIGFVA